MGAAIIFAFILCAVYCDAKTLSEENPALYRKHIGHPLWFWPLLIFFLFIVIIPLYLLRRSKYLKEMDSLHSAGTAYKNPLFEDMAEFTGILLAWSFFTNSVVIFAHLASKQLAFLRDRLVSITFASLLSDAIIFILLYLAIRKRGKAKFWESVSFKKVDGLLLNGILFPVIVGAGFAGISFVISESRIITSSPLQQILSRSSAASMALFSAMAMITGPFFEEIFFRGYFFTFISKIYRRIFAIGFVALIFALLHLDQLWGDWARFVIIFLVGLCITFFRARSGSVIPAMAAHYSYNISLLIIPVVYLFATNPAYCEYAYQSNSLNEKRQEQLLKESIMNEPDFSPAYNDLAWFYASYNKNLEEALKLSDRALRSKPDKAAYLDTKAEVLYKLKRFDEAIAIEKRLAERYPEDAYYAGQLEKFMRAKKDAGKTSPAKQKPSSLKPQKH